MMTSEKDIEELNRKLLTECKNQDLDNIKKLIANGAQARYIGESVGTCDTHKESILHAAISSLSEDTKAARETWKEIILVLLKNGANPNEKYQNYDWRGCGESQSVFDLMRNNLDEPDSDLLEAFLKAGMDPNLQRVVDLNSMRTSGCTKTNLLHDFSQAGDLYCVLELLEAGADVNICATENMINERGIQRNESETALHLAASNDNLEICIYLLAKGADINKKKYFTDSKLNEEIQNANVTDDPRDENYINPWENISVECTALHLALKRNHYDLAKFLLAAGANYEIPYKRGDDEISSFDLFSAGENSIIEKEEALKNALSGKISLELLMKSITQSVSTIHSALSSVQVIGWEMDEYNFREILEFTKLLLDYEY